MVQRLLSAKYLNHGRRGAFLAGFLKVPVIFIMIVPGVIAGLLSTISPSISATLKAATTLITIDLILKLMPNLSRKNLVTSGQIATVILVILAAARVSQIEKLSSLWEYLQLVLDFIAPPVASVFLLGLFWKRANANGAFASLLGGLTLSMILIISKINHWFPVINDIHFLHTAPLLLLTCLLIHIFFSLLSAPPSQENIENMTWIKAISDSESQELDIMFGYKNYCNLAILLLTALIVGYFI